MDTIILYRVGAEGQLQLVTDHEGDVAVFPNEANAEAYAAGSALFQTGQAKYQTVTVEI